MPKTITENPLTGKTKSGHILTEQEELFCNLFVTTYDRIESVVESYDLDKTKKYWRQTASAIAYENLLKPHINERIRELLDKYALTDETVDNELAFLLQQSADLPSKKGAIDIYNKIKGRYAPEKHEHSFKGVSDEELRKRASELISGIISDK